MSQKKTPNILKIGYNVICRLGNILHTQANTVTVRYVHKAHLKDKHYHVDSYLLSHFCHSIPQLMHHTTDL